jgi:hypothetical protein
MFVVIHPLYELEAICTRLSSSEQHHNAAKKRMGCIEGQRLNLTAARLRFARLGCLAAQIELLRVISTFSSSVPRSHGLIQKFDFRSGPARNHRSHVGVKKFLGHIRIVKGKHPAVSNLPDVADRRLLRGNGRRHEQRRFPEQ